MCNRSRMVWLFKDFVSFIVRFFNLSVNSEAEACDMAQPCPENFASFILLFSTMSWILISSPHNGLLSSLS